MAQAPLAHAPLDNPESPPSPGGFFSSDLVLPAINLYPFIPCLAGFVSLSSYLVILLLARCRNMKRFNTKVLKETLLSMDLSNVLSEIATNGGNKRRSILSAPKEFFQDYDGNEFLGLGGFETDLKDVASGTIGDVVDGNRSIADVAVDLAADQDGATAIGAEVCRAEVFSSTLHDLCHKLSSILSCERRIISFLVPRWKWSTTDYVMSLITTKTEPSKVVEEKSSIDQISGFCVPVSITFIRKRIQKSRSDPALEGPQLLANICKDASFEGAQLAVVCKAVQIMQENLEARWKMSFSIIRFTAANLLTIYAFWYTNLNSIQYLSAYIAGELVNSVYSQPLIDWLIPKLDHRVENVVLMLKLHLDHQMSSGASQEDLYVTDWMRSYFTKFDEVKKLLSIRDQKSKTMKRSFIRRTSKCGVSACLS